MVVHQYFAGGGLPERAGDCPRARKPVGVHEDDQVGRSYLQDAGVYGVLPGKHMLPVFFRDYELQAFRNFVCKDYGGIHTPHVPQVPHHGKGAPHGVAVGMFMCRYHRPGASFYQGIQGRNGCCGDSCHLHEDSECKITNNIAFHKSFS